MGTKAPCTILPPWRRSYKEGLIFQKSRVMFGLIHGFIQHISAKDEVQILILGLDGAGKTTLLEQMKGIYKKTPGIPPDRIPPTIGLNLGKMDVNNCRVIFWDLGGQVRMRSIWEKYFAEAHGMIYVIDAADEERMEEARLALGEAVVRGMREKRKKKKGWGGRCGGGCFALLAFLTFVVLCSQTEAVHQHEELRDIPILLLANKQDLTVSELERNLR